MEFNSAKKAAANSSTSSSCSNSSSKKTKSPAPCLRSGHSNHTSNAPRGHEHVRFDEAIIAEHDKLRGTRQKIDEAKTPYHQHNVDAVDDKEGNGASASSAAASPKHLSGNSKQRKSSVDYTASNPDASHQLKWGDLESRLKVAKDEVDEGRQPKVKLNTDDASESGVQHDSGFEEHRKKHYNEFQKMKEWRAQQAAGGDDDE